MASGESPFDLQAISAPSAHKAFEERQRDYAGGLKLFVQGMFELFAMNLASLESTEDPDMPNNRQQRRATNYVARTALRFKTSSDPHKLLVKAYTEWTSQKK